mgnify:CR=1 FL=1
MNDVDEKSLREYEFERGARMREEQILTYLDEQIAACDWFVAVSRDPDSEHGYLNQTNKEYAEHYGRQAAVYREIATNIRQGLHLPVPEAGK